MREIGKMLMENIETGVEMNYGEDGIIDLSALVGELFGSSVADEMFLSYPDGVAPAVLVDQVRRDVIDGLRRVLEPRGAKEIDLERAYFAYAAAFGRRYGELCGALRRDAVGHA